MIVSSYPHVSLNTANPPTELARRDMQRKELVEPVKETANTAAHKPVVTEDKLKQAVPAQTAVTQYVSAKETETAFAVDERQHGRESQQEQTGQQQQQHHQSSQRHAAQAENHLPLSPTPEIQQRQNVISRFYQQVTLPHSSQFLRQA